MDSKVCQICGERFFNLRHEGKRWVARKFCSKECYLKSNPTGWYKRGHEDFVPKESRGHSEETREKMSGKNNHMWKGGISVYGYTGRRIARKIVSELFGRKLKGTEVVHHIDGNTDNNDIENLFYFRNTASHTYWHHYLRRNARNMAHVVLKSNLSIYV